MNHIPNPEMTPPARPLRILALNGSPRRTGNTAQVLAHIREQSERQGHHWREILLARQKIHPCIGCGTCGRKGECVFDDDMVEIYREIIRADRVIIASPIYFYGLTAQCKLCIDRCQTLWSRRYILQQTISDQPDRRGYLVSVAATRGEQLFTGAILTARYGLDAMDIPFSGQLLFAGVDEKGAIRNHPDFPAQADRLAREILSAAPA